MQSTYIRVKRKKQCVFLSCELSEAVMLAKDTLAQILSQPAEDQRLIFNDEVLDATKSLEEQHVGPEDIVYLVYRVGDEDWEEIEVPGYKDAAKAAEETAAAAAAAPAPAGDADTSQASA